MLWILCKQTCRAHVAGVMRLPIRVIRAEFHRGAARRISSGKDCRSFMRQRMFKEGDECRDSQHGSGLPDVSNEREAKVAHRFRHVKDGIPGLAEHLDV